MAISIYRYNIAKAQIARNNLPPSSPRYKRELEIINEYEKETEEIEVEVTEKESTDPTAGLF